MPEMPGGVVRSGWAVTTKQFFLIIAIPRGNFDDRYFKDFAALALGYLLGSLNTAFVPVFGHTFYFMYLRA
jgi:hypothetical protein